MCCNNLVMQPTMATTRLVRPVCCMDSVAEPILPMAERAQLNMSWVVVTGEDGKRQIRMRWLAAQPDRG